MALYHLCCRSCRAEGITSSEGVTTALAEMHRRRTGHTVATELIDPDLGSEFLSGGRV